jgi:hypothetical protein
MIKFRNYGIEAYAIFRGGEMIPIMRCIRCIERKKDDLSNCALKYAKEMIYEIIVTVKGGTTVIINDIPKKGDS